MKIEKILNKKKGIHEYQARFQLAGKEFRPRALTRKMLLETIDEIRARQHRREFDLPVAQVSPLLSELFAKHLSKIQKEHQQKIATRVFKLFLTINSETLKITELKKTHFQKYIDLRASDTGKQIKQPITPQTINKQLYAISSALRDAPLYFGELEDYQKPKIPKAKEKDARRTRIVSGDELTRLLSDLRSDKARTLVDALHRARLADNLEFRYLTGMRRKEVARLKWENYSESESALRNVQRWKTGTTTKFFPLPVRAVEIIESRRATRKDSPFIFSDNGEPVESDYRTLKNVCAKLKIPYGRYSTSGFVAHDLRHNFATEIIQVTDLETAKSLTGHAGTQILTYLHTSEKRQREAINKRDKLDKTKEIVEIYKAVRRGKIKAKLFVEKVRKINEF